MSSPLSPEQLVELREAKHSAKIFLGAARVAHFNGWTLGFFAFLSILFGLFDLSSLFVGVGLAIIARNEFLGRNRIHDLDPRGLELLWRNQLGLMLLIISYCAWSIYSALGATSPEVVALLEMVGEGAGDLFRSLTLTVYGSFIAVTVIYQGLNARYYHRRVALMEDYLGGTPKWVVDLLRETSMK